MQKNLALMTAAAALLASPLLLPGPANAIEILAFSQVNGSANALTLTANGPGTQTTLAFNTTVDVTDILAGPPTATTPFLATMTLSATSILGSFTNVGGIITEHFASGNFSITGANCGGGNCLTGTFNDIAVGQTGGASLTLDASTPTNAITFTSSAIPAADLAPQFGIALSATNLTPPLAGVNTIASTTGFLTGTFSANAVPEPASLTLLGSALVGLGWFARRRRKSL